MTVRDGIYAVPAFIANTLIRCVVTGRVPAEGKEADYINTLCEHYKFILTVFQKRSIYPVVRIRRRRANKIRRTSKEETGVLPSFRTSMARFAYAPPPVRNDADRGKENVSGLVPARTRSRVRPNLSSRSPLLKLFSATALRASRP